MEPEFNKRRSSFTTSQVKILNNRGQHLWIHVTQLQMKSLVGLFYNGIGFSVPIPSQPPHSNIQIQIRRDPTVQIPTLLLFPQPKATFRTTRSLTELCTIPLTPKAQPPFRSLSIDHWLPLVDLRVLILITGPEPTTDQLIMQAILPAPAMQQHVRAHCLLTVHGNMYFLTNTFFPSNPVVIIRFWHTYLPPFRGLKLTADKGANERRLRYFSFFFHPSHTPLYCRAVTVPCLGIRGVRNLTNITLLRRLRPESRPSSCHDWYISALALQRRCQF